MTDRTPTADRGFARDLAAVLRAARYEQDPINEHLAFGEDGVELNPQSLPRYLRATAGGTPLDTLVRLFALGVAVPRELLAQAAAPMSVESWQAAGLVRLDGDQAHPALALAPQQGMWLAFDRVDSEEGRPIDYVMGLANSSNNLLWATLPAPIDRALDLGTGCGGTAIAQARRARQVIATDLNPRAVAFARFNAHLNGADNVEVRQGSLFEPVAGETFDSITMNAPYVIVPKPRYTYRDGGEQLVQALLRGAPDHLRPGGVCQTTAQWAHVEGQPWPARLAGWVEGLPLDTWVIRTHSRSIGTHTESWLTDSEKHDAASYQRHHAEWLDWFEAQGVTGLSTGLITARRRAEGPGWFDVTQDELTLDEHAGDAIAAGLRTRDHVHRADPAALMGTAFRLADAVELRQVHEPTGSGWQSVGVRLHLTRGLRVSVDIDERIGWLVGQIDGQRPMAELVEALASQLGVEVARLAQPLLTVTRLLVDKGFLLLPG